MKYISIALLIIVTLATGLCFVGCETESASENNVRITPAAAVILINDAILLIASGGFEYDWTLDNEAWGTLSARKGDRVIYTSNFDPGADTYTSRQVITVTSTLGTDTSGSNTLGYAQIAEAVVTHQTVQTAVTIDPPNANVKEFESVSFAASGANTYSWSLANEDWGSLTARQGPNTTYTSLHNPGAEEDLQILTCTSDRGTVTAHIIHDPEGVTISPTTASLTPGQSVTFTATGAGVANWSISGSGSPYVTQNSSGNSSTITMTGNFDDLNNPRVVTVSASSGDETAQASVSLYGTL
ncbi:MAG: hypothetical protein HN919_10015 [Verrucomicrobia bacterium]|jgi:hypothetical protein|nr:hypothetical protein [Verrucomicrobiota bacterium]MBT7066626.1 hypothetical protein [Verrucomicrobiota bacterium]MBT7699748.1 hypothetical protein [Verrucomicrobiota bacterium]